MKCKKMGMKSSCCLGLLITTLIALGIGFFGGRYYRQVHCSSGQSVGEGAQLVVEGVQPVVEAAAAVWPTVNNKVSGTVLFAQEENGRVRIVADLVGLMPGEHGFHIHDLGDCTCGDAECAGGHFNPTHQKHGGPDDAHRHVGDLGNVVADEHGTVHHEMYSDRIELNGPHSIIGRSVIIHADRDDYTSQPTGNAGKRVGCGVIGIKKIQR